MLAVRDDSLATLTPADGDYTHLRVNSQGALHITGSIAGLGSDATHDSAAVTTGGQIMAEFDDAAPDVVDEGDAGRLRIAANRNLYTTIRDAAGNERGLNIDASGQLAATIASGTITTVSTVTNVATIGTSIVPGTSATHLGKAVDAVAGATDTGVAVLAVRDDALATLTPIEGDYAQLRVNASGSLYVTGSAGVSEFNEDTGHGTGAAGNLGFAVRNDAGTALAGDGDYIPFMVNSAGALFVTGGGGGTEYVVNDVAAANATGTVFLMERDDAVSALTEVEGDWTNPRSNANGSLWIAVDGSVTVTDGAGALNVIVDSGTITTVSTVTSVTAIGTSVTPGTSAAHLGKAVDAVAGATDTGVLLLAVRDDTLASLTPVDGDYTQLRVNSQGALARHGRQSRRSTPKTPGRARATRWSSSPPSAATRRRRPARRARATTPRSTPTRTAASTRTPCSMTPPAPRSRWRPT